jgi:hypothetical protein
MPRTRAGIGPAAMRTPAVVRVALMGLVLVGLAPGCASAHAEDEPLSAKFFDPEDGWLDVGRFLDTAPASSRSAGRSRSPRWAIAPPSASPSSSATPTGGVRYELSRRHGLHMGLDVGFGPGGQPILYVIFGSAWFRP